MKRDNERCVTAYLTIDKIDFLERHKMSKSKSIRDTIDTNKAFIELGKLELYELSIEQLNLLVKELKNISLDPSLIGTYKTILTSKIRNKEAISTLSNMSEVGLFALVDLGKSYYAKYTKITENHIDHHFRS